MKIEKNIPLNDGRGRPLKYPWPGMAVGDSFFADIEPDVLRAAAYRYGQKHGMLFTVRREGDGARAWRTA